MKSSANKESRSRFFWVLFSTVSVLTFFLTTTLLLKTDSGTSLAKGFISRSELKMEDNSMKGQESVLTDSTMLEPKSNFLIGEEEPKIDLKSLQQFGRENNREITDSPAPTSYQPSTIPVKPVVTPPPQKREKSQPMTSSPSMTSPPPVTPLTAKPSTKPVSKPVAKPASKPKSSSSKKVSASTRKKVNAFWIQAGSYSTQSRAKLIQERLKEYGIHAIIQPFAQAEKKFYRVRVGGFLTRAEADIFLKRIKSVPDLKASIVIQAPTVREV